MFSPPHSTPSFVVFAQTAYFLRFYVSSLPVLPRPVLSFILLSLFCPVLIPLTAFSPQCGSLSRKGGPGGSVSRVHGGTLLQPFQTCIHLLLEWATPLPVSAAYLMLVHCAFQWGWKLEGCGVSSVLPAADIPLLFSAFFDTVIGNMVLRLLVVCPRLLVLWSW